MTHLNDILLSYLQVGLVSGAMMLLLYLFSASIISLFVLWYHLVRFQPQLDPDIVPPELTDWKSWSERIADYIRASNTRITIPFQSSILIYKMKFIMLVAAVTSIYSTSHLLRNARHALVALMNTKQNNDL